ncbi:glycosyltransferase family 2 protein [Micromonospora sp. NPDC005979]|uniref:glycosyltransferase family 2 protein n=1 Tax=Micromonospora sp. NPDC005979 TaxID=3156726 RepID=UPI0033A720F3
MSAETQTLALLNTAAFLLCVSFCAYVLSILVFHLKTRRSRGGSPDGFDWHVIVPCRNEASVIGDTLRRLLTDFPQTTVWCVDDASDDGTLAELAAFADQPRVHVVRRQLPDARQGKGAALNAAWRCIEQSLPAGVDRTKVIVGVLDADSRLDPQGPVALSGRQYFGADDVGAVQVEVRMLQCAPRRYAPASEVSRWGRLLIRLQDMEFRAPIAAMQSLRRQTGSVAMGGNGQFTRLSLLNDIAAEHGTPWHGALLEDFELGLHILLAGGRTEYCAESWVAQEALTRIKPLVRQRTRWAQGSMQCGRYLGRVLRSPRIRNSATLEIAHFLAAPWTQLLGTPVYLACLLVMTYYIDHTVGGLSGWWSSGGWGVPPLVLVFGVGPFALWGIVYRARCEPQLSVGTALLLGVCHWLYSYAQSLAVWLAFARMVTARTDWQKTARAADPKPQPAPVRAVGRVSVQAAAAAAAVGAAAVPSQPRRLLPARRPGRRSDGPRSIRPPRHLSHLAHPATPTTDRPTTAHVRK